MGTVEAFTVKSDKAPAYNEHQILEMMLDYSQNIAILENLREETNVGAGIAQYGIEATMPKGQGETGDPVFREYKRRNKVFLRYGEITEKLLPIQNFVESPDFDSKLDLINKIILDLTLEGKTQRHIASVVELSFQAVQKRQRQIAQIICEC